MQRSIPINALDSFTGEVTIIGFKDELTKDAAGVSRASVMTNYGDFPVSVHVADKFRDGTLKIHNMYEVSAVKSGPSLVVTLVSKLRYL